jgi:hypothetical protein
MDAGAALRPLLSEGGRQLFAPQWSPDGEHASALALDGQRIRLFDFKTGLWSDLARGWGLVRWLRDVNIYICLEVWVLLLHIMWRTSVLIIRRMKGENM